MGGVKGRAGVGLNGSIGREAWLRSRQVLGRLRKFWKNVVDDGGLEFQASLTRHPQHRSCRVWGCGEVIQLRCLLAWACRGERPGGGQGPHEDWKLARTEVKNQADQNPWPEMPCDCRQVVPPL